MLSDKRACLWILVRHEAGFGARDLWPASGPTRASDAPRVLFVRKASRGGSVSASFSTYAAFILVRARVSRACSAHVFGQTRATILPISSRIVPCWTTLANLGSAPVDISPNLGDLKYSNELVRARPASSRMGTCKAESAPLGRAGEAQGDLVSLIPQARRETRSTSTRRLLCGLGRNVVHYANHYGISQMRIQVRTQLWAKAGSICTRVCISMRVWVHTCDRS